MPPKEKVSKDMVRQAAFEMTKELGFGQVTARSLASRLKCSTQPIFRAYANMDELRTDVFSMSTEFFVEEMMHKKSRTMPVYMSMGMTYIDLAVREKNLFELIASVDDFTKGTFSENLPENDVNELLNKLPDTDELSSGQKHELFLMVWMFTHGVAAMVAGGRVSLSEKEIRTLLRKAYDGFVMAQKA